MNCEICTGVLNNDYLCEKCTEMVRETAGQLKALTEKGNIEKVVKALQRRT
jgi:hypothetical protein